MARQTPSSRSDRYLLFDRYGSVLALLSGCLCGGDRSVVCFKHGALQLASELSIDGVNDVTVCLIGILAARHNDEISVARIDDLDIVKCEFVVKRD